jgi:hypothetical protein
MTSAKPHTEQIKVGEELFSAAAAGYVVAGLLGAAVGAAAGSPRVVVCTTCSARFERK